MDGIHDLGGRHGFGRVEAEADSNQLPFQQHWQGAVFTIINALLRSGVAQNVDHFRHAVERIDPASYLTDGYYGRWLGAAETMLVEAGVLTSAEVTRRAVARGADPAARVAARPQLHVSGGDSVADEPVQPVAPAAPAPRFAPGQRVITRAYPVPGHTRLPAYARGVQGCVVAEHGTWVYPDSNAHGAGPAPQWLYTVTFAGADLWGPGAEPGVEVRLDLFEPYLHEADTHER